MTPYERDRHGWEGWLRIWNTEVFLGGWPGSWLFGILERNGLTCEELPARMERGEQGSFVR